MSEVQVDNGTVTQFYSVDRLRHRLYEGEARLEDLQKAGDFGIGTFNEIHGELIMVDGAIYRSVASGSTEEAQSLEECTPYSIVASFEPEWNLDSKEPLTLEQLQDRLDLVLSRREEMMYAIRVDGTFREAVTRAPDKQEKPYVGLMDLIAGQPEVKMENCSGTIVGFYTPKYMDGVGLPGYHLHFIDETRSWGGHLQSCILEEATVEAQALPSFKMVFS